MKPQSKRKLRVLTQSAKSQKICAVMLVKAIGHDYNMIEEGDLIMVVLSRGVRILRMLDIC